MIYTRGKLKVQAAGQGIEISHDATGPIGSDIITALDRGQAAQLAVALVTYLQPPAPPAPSAPAPVVEESVEEEKESE